MTKEEAKKYLQQLYPNDGHCWLDEQRIEAIGMAVKALQEEPVSEDLESEIQRYYVDWDEHPEYVQTARHFAKWQKEQVKKNNCTPTFDDAIEYGKEIVLAELERIIKDKEEAGKNYVFAFSEVKELVKKMSQKG